MPKRRTFCMVIADLLLAAGAGIAALKQKEEKPTQPVLAAAQAPVILEFLPTDVTQAKLSDLRQLLPMPGSLRADEPGSHRLDCHFVNAYAGRGAHGVHLSQ
jgi:membrane fusion protein (multidrug efflux system)